MNIIAPGKLILSGEHAVLYGHPVLAMAINRYITVNIQSQDSAFISLKLKDLNDECDFSIAALQTIKKRVRADYQRFLAGDLKVRDVLRSPMELVAFSISLLLKRQSVLPDGIKMILHSTVPMGHGLGSSAATIIATLYGLTQHLGSNLNHDRLLQLGLEAENTQHGQSSGIDLYMALHGGCVFKEAAFAHCELPKVPIFLINTGTPVTTTGECVAATEHFFKNSQIGQDFAAVTRALKAAVEVTCRPDDFLQAVRANHQLLVKIGVVPKKVQQFIQQIENKGGAAKIVGAGAPRGQAAGAVMALIADEKELQALSVDYGYSISQVLGESRGVHVI